MTHIHPRPIIILSLFSGSHADGPGAHSTSPLSVSIKPNREHKDNCTTLPGADQKRIICFLTRCRSLLFEEYASLSSTQGGFDKNEVEGKDGW